MQANAAASIAQVRGAQRCYCYGSRCAAWWPVSVHDLWAIWGHHMALEAPGFEQGLPLLDQLRFTETSLSRRCSAELAPGV